MKKFIVMFAIAIIGFSLFAEIRGEKMFIGDTPRYVYYDTDDYEADKWDYYGIEFLRSFNVPLIYWDDFTYEYDETINMGRRPINTDMALDARFAKYKYVLIDVGSNNTLVECFYTVDNEVVIRRWFYKTK